MLDLDIKDQWLWTGGGQLVETAAPINTMPTEAPPAASENATVHATPVVGIQDWMPAVVIENFDEILEPEIDVTASHWALGRSEFDSGRYAQAAEAYRTVLEERPGHRASAFNLAICLERLGRDSEAEEAYETALQQSKAPPEAFIPFGYCLLRLLKNEAAVGVLGQCLAQKPGLTQARFGLAVGLHRLGRLEEALKSYASIPSTIDNYAEVLVNIVAIAAERQDYAQLRDSGEELLKRRRHSHPALGALMMAEMADGDYKAAAVHGARLVKSVPDSLEAWFNLGLCYQKTNHTEQAAQAYTEAIKIRPDDAPAHANLGVILLQSGDISGARREFERVLELEPENLTALSNLALVHHKDGHVDKAEKVYLRLIREEHEVFSAAFHLGLLRLDRGNNIGAAEAFERCLLERSGDLAAQINLSLARWRTGDRNSATAMLRELLSKHPGSLEALHVRAIMAIEANDWRAASELEERLRELGEDTSTLAYDIGVLQQKDGLLAEAISSYRSASDQRPGFAEALLNLGHALNDSGKTSEAQAAWQAAMEAKPELGASYFKGATASISV